MAINKNALIRYKVLDRCFSNTGKRYFIEDLLIACNKQLLEIDPLSCGIKQRQLFDDIKFMESAEGWSADIQRISFGKRKYYRYSDSKFSINNQPLNISEIEHLKSAMDIISRFKGMPQFEWINELTPKLEQVFIVGNGVKPSISFDSNDYLTGIHYLGDLFHSIIYQKVLEIKYLSYKSEISKIFILHPYYLKQYNNRWFLFGWNQDLQKLTNLAIDRIQSIKQINILYKENREYNFEEYFEDIIGVTRPNDAETVKIVLKFDPTTLPYITSKPLHGSQKLIRSNGQPILVSIEVLPNYELESLILSFGEKIQVISPESLRNKIYHRLKNAVNLFEQN